MDIRRSVLRIVVGLMLFASAIAACAFSSKPSLPPESSTGALATVQDQKVAQATFRRDQYDETDKCSSATAATKGDLFAVVPSDPVVSTERMSEPGSFPNLRVSLCFLGNRGNVDEDKIEHVSVFGSAFDSTGKKVAELMGSPFDLYYEDEPLTAAMMFDSPPACPCSLTFTVNYGRQKPPGSPDEFGVPAMAPSTFTVASLAPAPTG